MVRNWVLVEHPGAWGPDALRQSGLPEHVSDSLAAGAREHGFRVLLLRRPERPGTGARHCFVAHSGRSARWIEERVVDDVEELLDVDFSRFREGRPLGFGAVRRAPLYLVCTNGRHDQCCANLGRPVARALHQRSHGSVWECTHFGGDRFAGNLVCLPHGLYFGRLTASDGVRVADGYEQGFIDLDHYRGTAGEPFAVQAAEFFLRRHQGLVGIADVGVGEQGAEPGGVVRVGLRTSAGRVFDVRVRVDPAAEARPLSCGAEDERRPPVYTLVDLRPG